MTIPTREVQIRVSGWYPGKKTKTFLPIDGVIGTRTVIAVKNFQRAYGLPITGTVTSVTERKLRWLEDPSGDGSTRNFKWSEFVSSDGMCFNGGSVNPQRIRENVRRMMWRLEVIRKKNGDRGVEVTSGFRSKRRNKVIGGAKNSMHTYGIAVDIRIRGRTAAQVNATLRTSGFSGAKGYGGFAHAHGDFRAEYNAYRKGSPAYWWP